MFKLIKDNMTALLFSLALLFICVATIGQQKDSILMESAIWPGFIMLVAAMMSAIKKAN